MYLSFNNPDLSPGVFRKEREFCNFLGEIGKDNGLKFNGCCIVASRKKKPESMDFGKYYHLKEVSSAPYRIFSSIPLFCSLFRIGPVFSEAYRDIRSFQPDVIIWRYNITYVPGIFNPKKINPKLVLITEHQAKENDELRMTKAGRILAPLIMNNGRKVLLNVNGVIGVTSEITKYELGLIERTVPSLTLTNSIDVEQYPLKRATTTNPKSLRLLYVGSHTADWQGIDRVLKGMARYRGDVKIELHIAGNLTDSFRELMKSLAVENQVIPHGYLTGEELDREFDLSDIAIGTLGIHRKKLSSGSTLKVREYMARGIPFMISYADEDISSDPPFIFKAPADESLIDMDEVIRFTRDLSFRFGNDAPRMMRDYALEYMDYRAKMIKLIDFIKSIHQRQQLICAES